MSRDNLPTVRLGSWGLDAALFDRELAAGPCPTLFSPDPDSALEALRANGVKAHYDIQRMLRAFFSHEIINLRNAVAIVKPR